jgi:hypothetical protein
MLVTNQFFACVELNAAAFAFIALKVQLIVRCLFRTFFRSFLGVRLALMLHNELLEHVDLLTFEAGEQFARLVVVVQFKVIVEGEEFLER